MIDITVKNLRNEKPTQPWQVKVDRSSPLGNPFFMKDESQRDEVCDKYKAYFDCILEDSPSESVEGNKFMVELVRLMTMYETYGKLELFCWCAPKRCHAETIRDFLISHFTFYKTK